MNLINAASNQNQCCRIEFCVGNLYNKGEELSDTVLIYDYFIIIEIIRFILNLKHYLTIIIQKYCFSFQVPRQRKSTIGRSLAPPLLTRPLLSRSTSSKTTSSRSRTKSVNSRTLRKNYV